ncbi:hypothetical protein GQ42DRAFT_154546 [Ramicandelaber brevisporus]|nr:hypothetical protein GQ42DRAFT_154546 [Ramicandelaber brevisporus]
MDISKLLNPLQQQQQQQQQPLKRPRRDSVIDPVLFNPESWLPYEIIGYIILFVDRPFRKELRLVSRAWYTAYMRYHRCSHLIFGRNYKSTNFTLTGALDAMRSNGRNLREMGVITTFFKELMEIEPNIGDFVPNVTSLTIILAGDMPSSQLLGDIVAKMNNLRSLYPVEYNAGLTDEHFLEELDKALVGKKMFFGLDFQNVHVTNMDHFPGPNLREIAPQISILGIPMSTINAENVSSKFALFCNVRELGLSNISSMEVLLAVANLLCEPKSMPQLQLLTLIAGFDITRTAPIQDSETGQDVRAYILIDRICSIRRPKHTLHINIGFTLGACSSGNPELIEIERKFLIDLGKRHSEVLHGFDITHFLPTSDYDPLSTLFYESAPRFPALADLNLHLPPTTQNKQRLIDAMNNPFLLPRLGMAQWWVSDDADGDFVKGFNPLDPSRGVYFVVIEDRLADQHQQAVEMGESIPSIFESEEVDQ